MSASAHQAVFLSYASQDAAAAARICEALRAAGVEVWFDQNELVGGDAWDAKIRKQIADCALFVPVISAATQARLEGYFRIEWKLAARRTHAMATAKAFLLPVVIDDTRDAEAHVPDEFRDVQWTRLRQAYGGQARLPGGEAPEKFCARVQALLAGEGRDASLPRQARDAELVERARRPASDAGESPGRLGETSLPTKPAGRVPAAAWIAAAALTLVVAAGAWLWLRRPASGPGPELRRDASATTTTTATPLSEARKLTLQARALIDDDPVAVRQNFILAEELCKKAVALDVSDGEAWATYARVSLGFWEWGYDDTPRRRELARSQSQRAIRLAPDSIEAGLAEAGLAYFSRPRYELTEVGAEPERRLRSLLRQAPTDRRIYRLLANTVARSGQAEEASALRQKSNALPGGDPQALSDDAVIDSSRNPWEADQMLDRVFAATPTKAAYYWRLGIRVHRKGDLDAARMFLATIPEQLMSEDLFAAQAYILWLRLGDPAKALAAIEKIPRDFIEERRQIYPRATLVGLAHALAGRDAAAKIKWREALRLVDQRLTTESNQPVWVFNKALLLALLGDKTAAKEQLDAFRQLGAYAEFLASDGTPIVLLLLGETNEAIGEYQRLMARTGILRMLPLSALRFDPLLKPIRDDPRVQAMIKEGLAWLEERRLAAATNPATTTNAPAPTAPSPSRQPEGDAKSVAVLAFKNLSGDPAREFFSDGLSEAVTDVLGRVPGLKVVGSASAFSFKGKFVPIPEIARQLGVTHLVEGTVLQEGQTVRITAKLIQADGFQVWVSDKLDRELKNIFALHDEVAGLIAKNLSLKLGASSAASKAAVNPEAFELYVQARQALNLLTPEGYDRAESALDQALKREPNFARAHAALADVWKERYRRGRQAVEAEDQNETARILAKIRQALALDPDSTEAHVSHGVLLMVNRKYSEAEPILRRAVALNPNDAAARDALGRALLNRGKMDEALVQLKLSTELDPLSWYFWGYYGEVLRIAGRTSDGIKALDRSLGLRPDFSYTVACKSFALLELARVTEAVALVRGISGGPWTTEGARLRVFARAGLKAEAEALLAASRPPGYTSFRWEAGSLVALGRIEEAMALLTSQWSSSGDLWDSIYDPVRNDPRWVKFLADAGLTEAHARAQAWRKAHPAEKAVARP